MTNRNLAGKASFVIPSLRGTLTGASINLTAVSGDAYSSDLTLAVTPSTTAPNDNPRNALAQIGGYWGDFVQGTAPKPRFYWVPQAQEAAVPLAAGPISFSSSYNLTTNTSYRVWVVNGYTAGAGTFTGTITLHGVTGPAFYPDADNDGYGDSTATAQYITGGTASGSSTPPTLTLNSVPAGYVTNNSDCNDGNAAIKPDAVENCANDGVDNDCDGVNNAAEAVDSTNYYADADNDNYTTNTATKFCSAPASGYEASPEGDCNDANDAVYPGAPELCATAGVDNNCDSNLNDVDANAADKVAFYRDADNDGVSINTTANFCSGTSNAGYITSLSSPVDCNDASSAVYPGAVENCANDGVDNDCDGEANSDAEAVDSTSYWVDADSDTYGSSAAAAVKSCTAVSGSVTNNTDCNDASSAVYPGAPELCATAGVDNNCDSNLN
ncbi:MAG: putative metal-binding motif-containing protein, partial [Phycisphaerales bacterium]